jgi:hypothetical protein
MAFKKGQSGNPGGRPKEAQDVKEMAKTHSRAALERLVHWMQSNNPKASVSAANAILDRAYGKPSQTIDANLAGELGTYAAQPIPVESRDSDSVARPTGPAANGHSAGHS